MKKNVLISLILIPLIIFTVAGSVFVFAEEDGTSDTSEEAEKVEDLLEQIEEYEDKIDDLQGEANSLSREIEKIDTNIRLTELQIQNSINKIAATERKIADFSFDIERLIDRIEVITERIEYQEGILKDRIRERYKTGAKSPVLVLFGASTLENLVKKATYLKVMEIKDSEAIDALRNSKEKNQLHKKQYELSKKEEEKLQAQLLQEKANLDAYKNQLNSQKAEKDRLLEVTQNDEEKYQDLLAEAKAELESYSAFVQLSGLGLIGPNGLGGGEDGWYYSQRDSRWANNKIGNSSYSIFESGCLVSSVAMVHTYYGYNLDPGDLADEDGYYFYGNMLIPWPAPSGRDYRLLGYGYPESGIDGALDNDNPVIVGVTANNAAGTHFVVLIEGEDGDYEMHDPIYGPNLDFDDYYSTSQIFEAVVFD